MKPYLLFFSILVFCFPVHARFKLFQNTYVSFEIPETWECKSFGTDWICHSKLQKKKVEALITSTAKIAGPYDTLDQYLDYLQQPKTWSNIKKEQFTSQRIKAERVFINKFPWVDSIHKNSEIKSYISRYVGTVCCKDSSSQLGILIVLSAHQTHYKKYSADFIRTVNSLKVMDIEKAISKVRAAQAAGGGGMSQYLEGLFEDDTPANLKNADTGLLGLKPSQLAGLIAAVLVALSYFIIRKRRKGGRSKKSRRSRRAK